MCAQGSTELWTWERVLVKVDEELQFSFSNEINSIARMHNVDDTLAPLTRPKASGKKKKKEHEMPTKGLQ